MPQAPSSVPQLARSDIEGGNGQLFAIASVDGPTIDQSLAGTGGSCFQGTVRTASGQLYSSFFVQASNGASTVEARSFPDSGNYRVCGLSAGRWGVAIYAINGVPLGSETAAHQARVTLSGTPGEVYYINFRAKADPPTPTLEPTVAPTATPFNLYDGSWRANLRLPNFEGSLAFDVINGRLVSLGVNGGSCVWTHNQNLSIDLASGSFGYDGPSSPPGNIRAYSLRGSFSGGQASGTLSATDAAGNQCLANVPWTATR